MRCIEIGISWYKIHVETKINRNMRCIEMCATKLKAGLTGADKP